MKKNPPTTTTTDRMIESWQAATALRDAADTTLREARAASEAARRPGCAPPPETRVELLVLAAESLTSVDVEASARARLTWSLDAHALATGDPLAAACAIEPLAKDLDAGIAEIARLRQAIAEEERRMFARIESARSAHTAIGVKRTLAGLPEPRRIPSSDGGFQELVDRLKSTIAKGPIAPSSAEKISRLRREELAERAALEMAARASATAALEREADAARAAADERARVKLHAEENARGRARVAAERAAEMDLAGAHRARTA